MPVIEFKLSDFKDSPELVAKLVILAELAGMEGAPNAPPRQKFLDAYSRAFLSWQFVEANLSALFSTLTKGESITASTAAYHAVLNLNIRLRMIDAAVQIVIKKKDLLDKWAALSRSVSTKANNRNNLAHFTVAVKQKNSGEILYLLCPTFRNPLAEKKEFDTKQILSFRDDFIKLSNDLDAFHREIDIPGKRWKKQRARRIK